MAQFQRLPNRFVCTGLNLNSPFDLMAPGKFPAITNMRAYTEGELNVRPGTQILTTLPGPVHSLFRLNDPTPSAAYPAIRIFGAGGNLYACPVAGPYPPALHVSGFSGNPLTGVPIQPTDANQPYLYIADSVKQGKMRTQGDFFQIGTPAPRVPPVATLQALGFTVVNSFSPALGPGAIWVPVSTGATGAIGIVRVNTTVSQILYDTSAPGYASVVPADLTNITSNMLIQLGSGAGGEETAVTEVTIAVASTTIAAILYDSGTTGLCTIQPAASLGTGQINAPSLNDIKARYGLSYAVPRGTEPTPQGTTGPATPGVVPNPVITQVDFPVNALVTLGGTETVRILSVAIGQDGVQSFRCVTTSPHAINETLTGVAAFRCFLNGTYSAGAPVIDWGMECTLTPIAPNPNPQSTPAEVTDGLRSPAGWAPRNLALINGRATLPGDLVNLAIRVSDCTELQTVRLYLSLEPTASSAPSAADFTENYYFFEWRQSDITAAIQSTNPSTTDTLTQAQATVLANQQLGPNPTVEQLKTYYGTPIWWLATQRYASDVANSPVVTQTPTGETRATPTELANFAASSTAISAQLALGNNQWITLTCKVSDLNYIGTSEANTLANVTAAEVLAFVEGSNPVTFDIDEIWVSGGYEPYVSTGNPYVWSYRYRSSLTGTRSNPSPTLRGGVVPNRQAISLAGTASSDPQIDLVDWFRLGGNLLAWTYSGTVANGQPYLDEFGDSAILGGEGLNFDLDQPWPSIGIDVTAQVNVAGSAVQWVSGQQFDPRWAPGNQIRLNGQPYTLYAQPTATFLQIVENAGAQFNVPCVVSSPTILSIAQPTLSEDYLGFHFSVGDPAQPGTLKWTNGNDPETTSSKNSLVITSPSEPLIVTFLWDGVPFVFSSDNLYRIEPDFANPNVFRAFVTPCGRGLWSPWAWCLTPQGLVFLAKDGLYITTGGDVAQSLTNDDLYSLFPHDGIPGISVNGYKPPDLTQPTNLRLCYVDGYVYFDFAVAA